MADINFPSLAQNAAVQSQVSRGGHGQEAETVQRLSVSDQVQLSNEAKRRMEQLQEGQTVAEAFLKHVLESRMEEATASGTEQDVNDDDAKNKMKGSIERLSVDLGWLVEALGVAPTEKSKLQAALMARSSIDYAQSRPPVPEIILRAEAGDDTLATLFVQELSIDVHKDSITTVSVQRVAVTHANTTLAGQLGDPTAPRVVYVGSRAGDTAQDGKAAFEDNVLVRLANSPSPELHGMLIVREFDTVGDSKRLRVDALMPLQS